jgi:tRNA threonylcarbamoyladenosine biosynthesis protein TsaE
MELPAEFESASEGETRGFARLFARALFPGDVVAVTGELGTGKTVFIRGLAEGLGCDPLQIASPTFALVHDYGDLVHLDLYRVSDDERELREIGLPEVAAGKVAAIEWPGRSSRKILPPTYEVRLEAGGPGRRRVRIERPSSERVAPPNP